MDSMDIENNGCIMKEQTTNNSLNKTCIEPQNQLLVSLRNRNHPSSSSSNVASRLFEGNKYSDCLLEASSQNNSSVSHVYKTANSYLERFSDKILCFLITSSLILSTINLILISSIINSTKLTKGGLADGRVSATENGILINGTLKVSGSMTLDSMRAVNGQNLDFSNPQDIIDISNSYGTKLFLDGHHQKIEITANRYEYIDTSLKDVRKVLLRLDAKDNSVSLYNNQLRPNTRSGYNLLGSLETSDIVGTLDHDLKLQSRTGNLQVESRTNQVIQSKASSIDVRSYNSFLINSPKIDLSSERIRIERSLTYFDEYYDTSRIAREHKLTDLNDIFETSDTELESDELLSNDGWLCHA